MKPESYRPLSSDIFIDISLPLQEEVPIWPGSVGFHIARTMRMEDGDPANVSRLDCDVHVGTHVETSLHFIPGGRPVDTVPLDILIGPAWVGYLPNAKAIGAVELEALGLPRDTRRLLLRTSNSELWKAGTRSFRQDYVGLTPDAARWVVEHGIRLLGTDYLSVAAFSELVETHRILMSAEVVILEGLDLSEVSPGAYELICLPLKLVGAEAAPARAVLRPLP